jgi:multiple sugar transport system ATP-binding protein
MQVQLEELSKTYGNYQAVYDVSLDIKEGEFMVLLGPSGSGKTTTLRMIAGLTTPDTGRINFDGRIVNQVHPAKRDVAMVFQDYALYPHKAVFDNIAFNLKVKKVTKREIQERVTAVAKLLRIDHLLDRKPRQLSGGERQRVALGRAIVRDPALFLMDEPLSNLDAKLREDMRLELKDIQRRLNVTTIYVTHDQVEAMVLADRIAVMHEGRMQQVGTPSEIYTYPTNLFVAQFVGTPRMNLLRGYLKHNGTALVFVSGDQVTDNRNCLELPLPPEVAEKLISSDIEIPLVCSLGFRAEAGQIRANGEGAGVIPVSVDFVEYLGADQLAIAKLPEPCLAYQETRSLIVRSGNNYLPGPGDQAFVHLEATHVCLFDQAAGRALYCAGRVMV